jgi:hypothetical protein
MANFSCGILRFGQTFLCGEMRKLSFRAPCLEVSTPACVLWLDFLFLTTLRAGGVLFYGGLSSKEAVIYDTYTAASVLVVKAALAYSVRTVADGACWATVCGLKLQS